MSVNGVVRFMISAGQFAAFVGLASNEAILSVTVSGKRRSLLSSYVANLLNGWTLIARLTHAAILGVDKGAPEARRTLSLVHCSGNGPTTGQRSKSSDPAHS